MDVVSHRAGMHALANPRTKSMDVDRSRSGGAQVSEGKGFLAPSGHEEVQGWEMVGGRQT